MANQESERFFLALFEVLNRLVLVSAPFIPFTTDEIYRNLRIDGSPESVHLCRYPVSESSRRDKKLEHKMAVTRKAVSLGRALRTSLGQKIRQPLRAVHMVTKVAAERSILLEMQEIIKDELNVKDVVFRDNEEELVSYRCQANYRLLGKQLGKNMKSAAAKIAKLTQSEIQSLMDGAVLSIDLGEQSLDLTAEGVVVSREEKANLKVLNEGSLTVGLDTQLTEDLVQEGMVRDVIRSVQNMRKEKGLQVTDRIVLDLFGSDELEKAVQAFEEHLTAETLSVSWNWKKATDATEINLAEGSFFISLRLSAEGED